MRPDQERDIPYIGGLLTSILIAKVLSRYAPLPALLSEWILSDGPWVSRPVELDALWWGNKENKALFYGQATYTVLWEDITNNERGVIWPIPGLRADPGANQSRRVRGQGLATCYPTLNGS